MIQFSTSAQWNSEAQLFGTANTPIFELRGAATCAPLLLGFKMRMISIRQSGGNGTASLGIATDAWTGTPRVSRPMAAQDPVGSNTPFGLNIITEWSKTPTVPAIFRRRFTLAEPGGGGKIAPWVVPIRFQRGLSLAPNTSLIIWLLSMTMDANSNMGSIELDEIEVDA